MNKIVHTTITLLRRRSQRHIIISPRWLQCGCDDKSIRLECSSWWCLSVLEVIVNSQEHRVLEKNNSNTLFYVARSNVTAANSTGASIVSLVSVSSCARPEMDERYTEWLAPVNVKSSLNRRNWNWDQTNT